MASTREEQRRLEEVRKRGNVELKKNLLFIFERKDNLRENKMEIFNEI